MASNALQEFVIKLSAQVDNSGVGQMMQLLDSNKLKALGVTAALTAATTAVYKFVESATKTEIELTALAKKQGKTIEATRASETALKAMGKTLNEVKKDKALESIYNDLVKVNKAMALPDMSDGITMIRNLQGAFWELRSTVTYAIQWINAKILANLEEPINRITSKLHEISQWVQQNMQSITTKVSSFITGFAKGVIGIIEGIEKIVNWVHELPEGIQRIGSAVGVVWALIKSGPIGQILTVVTAIGGLIDDYENFQWNKLHEGEEGFEKVGVAFEGIWEKLEDGDVTGIINDLLTSLTGALTSFSETLENLDLGEFLKDPSGKLGGFVDQIVEWFGKDAESGGGQGKLEALGGAIWGFISQALAFSGDFVTDIATSLVTIFTGDELDAAVTAALGDNSVASGLGTGLVMKLLGFGNGASLAGGLVSAWTDAQNEAKKLLATNHDQTVSAYGTDNPNQIAAKLIGIDVVNLGKGVFELLKAGVSAVDGAGSILFGAIADAIGKDTALGGLAEQLAGEGGQGSVLGDAIVRGVLGGATTGNFFVAIGGFLTRIIEAMSDPKQYEQLKGEVSSVGEKLVAILFGTMDENGKYSGGIIDLVGGMFSGLWEAISPMLEPLWNGLRDGITTFASSVWDLISPYVDVLVYNITAALRNSGLGGLLDFLGLLPADSKGSSVVIDENGQLTTIDQMAQNGASTTQIAEARKRAVENPAVEAFESNRDRFKYNEGDIHPFLTNDWMLKTDSNGNPFFDRGSSFSDAFFDAMSKGSLEYANQILELSNSVQNANPATEQGNQALWSAWGQLQEIKAKVALLPEIKSGDVQNALDKTKPTLKIDSVEVNPNSGFTFTGRTEQKNAYGGRFDSEHNGMTVGEDGTEYIIPITKPERAYSLIMQMLGEMGSTAVTKIMTGLGIGEEGTLGGSVDALAASLGGLNMNVNYTISAPVSIVVNSSSANAEDVGTAAYNAAERHLLRNMRGVFA